MNASPLSTANAPSSYNSELDNSSVFLLKNPSDEQSSSSKPSTAQEKLREIQCLSFQCTQAATKPFVVNNESSLVSSPLSQDQKPLYGKSSDRSWISALLSTKFYGPCRKHSNLRKNDLNFFCTNHAIKICQYCNQWNHSSKHACTILHVFRYMRHDVLLAKEAAALIDVSEVQSYISNRNRVVYIDRCAQPKYKLAPHAKACASCSRKLQGPYRFCSVSCRLAHAKDPAAVPSLPVPDACPLLKQNARKTKTYVLSPSPSHSKRNNRSLKRLDRIRSPTMSPVTPTRPSMKASSRMAPALQLTPPMKKSRRKGIPERSPSLYDSSVLLSHGTY